MSDAQGNRGAETIASAPLRVRAAPPVFQMSRKTHGQMDLHERITIEPGKRSGKPCIRGMRITVQDVLEYLASGMSEDEILEDFPYLEREDIRACLVFAAERERRLMAGPGL